MPPVRWAGVCRNMVVTASRFQQTDIVIMGIILIGIIGYGIDILMRMAERWLVPWKGKG